MISTGNRFAPGFSVVEQAAFQSMRQVSAGQIEFYAEHLDIVRFTSEGFHRLFRDYLREKYADNPPDVIILIYVGNLGTAAKLLEQLFPGVPVVVAGLTEEEVPAGNLGRQITGLAQRSDPRGTMELILRLQPAIRRIVVIGGAAEVDTHVMGRAREAARALTGRIEFDFWSNRPMSEIRNAVRSLSPQTAILFTRMFRDGAGRVINSVQAAQLIAESANVPVYIMTDTMLGTGAIGGSVVHIEALGQRAGEMAKQILDGAPPASLLFEIRTDGVPTFDWRALKRWGISDARLPTGSIVRFREPTLWEHYRWYLVGALLAILLQAALIAGLVVNRIRRRQAETKLREDHHFIELATKAARMGLWMRDLEKGELSANSHFRSLFGFGETDAIRFDDVLARIHPYDRGRLALDLEGAEKNGLPFEGEFRLMLTDGSERWVVARGETFNEPRRRSVRRVGAVIDITDRKRAEELLRESEARFRTMADTAPVMIWMAGPDMRCTFFNKGWLDFTGRTLEQELGDGWTEGVHQDDFDHCLEVYTDFFNARREFTMEYRLRRRDGQFCWVLDNGVPRYGPDGSFSGYIGSCTDLTARKKMEEILIQERGFLRQVIDVDPNFIFAKDREGRFTLVNQAVADSYGTTVENLIGKTDADVNPNIEEVEFFRRTDQEVMNTMQERFIPEEQITDAKGSVHWLQTVKRPIVGSDGQAYQVLGSATDITERKRTETELLRQRDELAHVTRVSMMGELAASLAHELNQPLTAILSNAQAAQRFLMAKRFNLDEVREILKDIVDDNRRAGEIIRRIRALVKKEELAFARLDLLAVIREVVSLVHSDAILRNVHMHFKAGDQVPPISGDKIQLQQVLLNLFLNAFEAMKDCRADQRQVLVRVDSNGAGMVEVTVRDRGIGLTSDKLDRIFEPFFTTKRDGLGIGLSISQSIVYAHGGRLWVENNQDCGATFHVVLPVCADAQPKPESPP